MIFLCGFAVAALIGYFVAFLKLEGTISGTGMLDFACVGIALGSGLVGGFGLLCLYFLGVCVRV